MRRRITVLQVLIDATKTLRIQMVSMFEPVQNSLKQSESELMVMIGEKMQAGGSASNAWKEVQKDCARKGGAIDALTAEDRHVLDRLFEHLGENGREAQEILLSSTLQSLEQQLDSARAHAKESERLYISLGLLIGLMLALIVI